jgi:transposase
VDPTLGQILAQLFQTDTELRQARARVAELEAELAALRAAQHVATDPDLARLRAARSAAEVASALTPEP